MGFPADYGCPEKKLPSLNGGKITPTLKFLGMFEAYFVCHIRPNFQISLIYAFIRCPKSELWGKHSLARSWKKVLMMRMTTTCATPRPRPRRLLRISYVLCMWHVETRLPSWRTRRLDIYLFFQTTHVYDEKFPIPTTLVCMRAKKIPKGRAAGGAARYGGGGGATSAQQQRKVRCKKGALLCKTM